MFHKDDFVTYEMLQSWRLDEGGAVVMNEVSAWFRAEN